MEMRFEILTERLCVAIADIALVPALVAYATDNQEHFARWSPPRPDNYFTTEFWLTRVTKNKEDFDAGASACFTLLDRHAPTVVVGECNFTGIMRGPFQSCFLGFNLDEAHVGRGLMQEALRALIAFAFGQMRLHRIGASYMPVNERSGRVLRALNFTVDGYAKDYLFLAGTWRDHILTSLVNSTMTSIEI